MSSERRLHPLSIVFGAGPQLLRAALPIVLLAIASSSPLDRLLVVTLWLTPIFGLFILIALLRWLRFTYRYDDRDLVVRSGLLTRNERRIPYARIQNLDASQNLLQRLTGVVAVFVQTGGGEEPEASLRVLPLGALNEMRERVIAAGGHAGAAVTAPQPSTESVHISTDAVHIPTDAVHLSTETVHDGTEAVHDATSARRTAEALDLTTEAVRRTPAADPGATAEIPVDARAVQTGAEAATRTLLVLGPRELIIAGFIENRGMVVIAGVLALLEQAGLSERFIERIIASDSAIIAATLGRWSGVGDVPVVRGAILLLAAALTILLFIRLLSTVWAVVRLYDFRLERTGDDLHTSYGLFTRVSATIPLRRVQTVIVREGILHRALGRCSVRVETAGGTMATTGAPQREPIAPILHNERLADLLDVLHPGLALDAVMWRPVHSAAFGRVLRGVMFWPLALSGTAWFFIGPWSLAVLAASTTLAAIYARMRSRNLAWSITDDAVLARDGAFMRTVRAARFNRVQVPALVRNPLDLRTGMARVRADTAGARGGLVIPFLGTDVAEQVHAQLVARTAATAFTW